MRKFVLSRGTSGKTHSGSAAVCFERLRPRAARERVSLTCVSRLFFGMALSIAGQTLTAPAAKGKPADLFAALCTEFKIDQAVGGYFVGEAIGLESLEDFAHYFSSEAEIAETVKKIPDLGHRELNISRLRQAWDAAKKGLSAADTRKRRGIDDADIDNVLPAPELTGLKNDFYARCGLVVCSVQPRGWRKPRGRALG